MCTGLVTRNVGTRDINLTGHMMHAYSRAEQCLHANSGFSHGKAIDLQAAGADGRENEIEIRGRD